MGTVPTTPHLGLALPPSGETGWTDQMNGNLSTIDAAVYALQQGGTTGPAGSPGAQGAIGMIWTGPWSSTVNYVATDAVYYNGASYIARAANSNTPPDSNPNTWNPVALMGQPGPTGPPGQDGATGPAGPPGQSYSGPGIVFPIAVSEGGTGSTTPSDARNALGAAASGNNHDITQMTALATAATRTAPALAVTSPGGSGTALYVSNGTSSAALTTDGILYCDAIAVNGNETVSGSLGVSTINPYVSASSVAIGSTSTAANAVTISGGTTNALEVMGNETITGNLTVTGTITSGAGGGGSAVAFPITVAEGGTGSTTAPAALAALGAAPKNSPAFTGTPSAPTIPISSNNTGLATTAAVSAAIAAIAFPVTSFKTRTGAIVPAIGDYTVAQVSGAAASGVNLDITALNASGGISFAGGIAANIVNPANAANSVAIGAASTATNAVTISGGSTYSLAVVGVTYLGHGGYSAGNWTILAAFSLYANSIAPTAPGTTIGIGGGTASNAVTISGGSSNALAVTGNQSVSGGLAVNVINPTSPASPITLGGSFTGSGYGVVIGGSAGGLSVTGTNGLSTTYLTVGASGLYIATGPASIGGSLSVGGNSTFTGNATVGGNETIGGSLAVNAINPTAASGQVVLGASSTATYSTVVGGNGLQVTGTSGVGIPNGALACGNIVAPSSLANSVTLGAATYTAADTVVVQGGSTATNALHVKGNATVTGNLTVNGTQTVTGNQVFNGIVLQFVDGALPAVSGNQIGFGYAETTSRSDSSLDADAPAGYIWISTGLNGGTRFRIALYNA